jgi:hypothetical protein
VRNNLRDDKKDLRDCQQVLKRRSEALEDWDDVVSKGVGMMARNGSGWEGGGGGEAADEGPFFAGRGESG